MKSFLVFAIMFALAIAIGRAGGTYLGEIRWLSREAPPTTQTTLVSYDREYCSLLSGVTMGLVDSRDGGTTHHYMVVQAPEIMRHLNIKEHDLMFLIDLVFMEDAKHLSPEELGEIIELACLESL